MAVKKHELVHDHRLQPDLATLEKYLQLMNEQHAYLPPPTELVKTCQDIVKCLSRASGNEEDLWLLLQAVEEFLIRIMNTVSCEVRQEVVTAILDKFYSLISDPQSDACPATSTVLVIIDGTDNDASISAARWLVQERDNGPGGAGLRSALSCLYRWMYEWHGTPSFGEWIMSYIKALEENERFDILIEVSVDNLASMFAALDAPALRHSNADVVFHVLASLRESTDALDRISPHVGRVLTQLAAESGQWSRTLLQNIVDIVSAMIDCLSDPLQGEAKNEFRVKYADVIGCLERHMASRGCRFLQLPPWRARGVCVPRAPSVSRVPIRKVGLINLGNTCYMNSVMQALLVTRQFSTHVVLKMNGVPYWSNVSMLFAKMLYSISTKLNPEEFFTVVKPPFFTTDIQHDSSEFLGYLFELLASYEHRSDLNHDYSKPAVLNSTNRLKSGPVVLQSNSDNNHPGTSQNRRSVSPRPGSSAAGSSSSMKRLSPEDEIAVPPKKRMRIAEAVFLRRDSFIDSLFGGVLLTRVECTHCHSSSLSRDVFRDLQLAFPEKPASKQHSVQSLLEFYCSKERLSGDNKYRCSDCGVLREAERSVLIETTPKHLILVLKHFKFDSKLQVQSKLCYPMNHNNSKITLPTVRSQADHAAYTLYAAVIHSGTTLNSGHYYTLAKDNDQWYLCNDDVVTVSDESKLVEESTSGATPYILFYRRNDVEEPAAPALEEVPQALQEMVLAHNKHYVETVRQMHITRP